MINVSLYDQELIRNDYHPNVNFYYFKRWDDFRMPFHQHPEIEIMYVISGQCTVEICKQAHSLKKGECILIDSNISHRLLVEKNKPCRMLNIEFNFVPKTNSFPSIKEIAMENVAFRKMLSLQQPYFLLQDPNEVYHTLKSLVLELDEQKTESKLMYQLLFSQLMIQIAKIVVSSLSATTSLSNIHIKKSIDYMHHNYDCDIQVKDIAEAVHLHPSYLQRIFKEEMGCTMMEYLASFRVEKAKMLLLHSEIPITKISEYIGINSRQYFSTLFKRYTGRSPLDYRTHTEKWNNNKALES